MKRLFLLFLSIIIFQSFALAQTNNSQCPYFSVQGVMPLLKPEENINYKVVFNKGFDTSKLIYIWTVYNGKILNGQGTSAIFVKPEKRYEKSITASVRIQNLPENCPNTASETASIDPRPAASEVLPCPIISVTGPSVPIAPGENIIFTGNISKEYDTSSLKYLWTVSAGKIVSGQGTLSIVVNSRNAITVTGGLLVTATFEVQGLPANCANTASESFICPHCGGLHRVFKIDEYKRISIRKEKLRLNKLADELQNYPGALIFIAKSFSRSTSKPAAYRDLIRILDYLQSRGISRDRIFFGATYGKEEQTTLFIIPPGVNFPEFDDEILNAKQLADKLNLKAKTK